MPDDKTLNLNPDTKGLNVAALLLEEQFTALSLWQCRKDVLDLLVTEAREGRLGGIKAVTWTGLLKTTKPGGGPYYIAHFIELLGCVAPNIKNLELCSNHNEQSPGMMIDDSVIEKIRAIKLPMLESLTCLNIDFKIIKMLLDGNPGIKSLKFEECSDFMDPTLYLQIETMKEMPALEEITCPSTMPIIGFVALLNKAAHLQMLTLLSGVVTYDPKPLENMNDLTNLKKIKCCCDIQDLEFLKILLSKAKGLEELILPGAIIQSLSEAKIYSIPREIDQGVEFCSFKGDLLRDLREQLNLPIDHKHINEYIRNSSKRMRT